MIEPGMHADQAVAAVYDAMSREDATLAGRLLDEALPRFPLDSRLHVMRAVLAAHHGSHADALAHLWRALAAEPDSALARGQLLASLLLGSTCPDGLAKDFSLDSGERQVAPCLDGIRADHRARYAFAARWLRRRWPDCHLRTGLDAFAGNGYGSRLVADQTGARMVGLDGSGDAVALAERHYADHRVVFGHAVFPFALRADAFDFCISFESIEHVDAPTQFLHELAQATRGPLLVSVPNEHALRFATYGTQFQHHTRHFTRGELTALMASTGRAVVSAALGQDVYLTDQGRLAGLLPEHRMSLHPLRADSQFLIMVFEQG